MKNARRTSVLRFALTSLPRPLFTQTLTFWMLIFAVALVRTAAQAPPSLSIQTIQVIVGGPIQLTFRDDGTGSTRYRIERASSAAPPIRWSDASAAITALGGGQFRGVVTALVEDFGLFRVIGISEGGGETASATFDATDYLVREGGPFSARVNFTAPFNGLIRYTVRGTDFNQSGEVAVNGMTAAIPVNLPPDDDQVNSLKLFTLELVSIEPALPSGANSRSVITLEDNDSTWAGMLQRGAISLPFTLEILKQSNTTLARATSDGAGLFPPGTFPAASFVFESQRFSATFPNVPLPAESTPLGAATTLTLTLSADSSVEGSVILPNEIQGTYALATTVASQPHFNTATTGQFLLLQRPPAPAPDKVALSQAP
ncbi:MAG: hypothetical protein L0Z50_04280 [Verrucomicrobiales bacterium]|nr:hypothetical protein [Verrucomicrobiales bacterium]